MTPDIRRQFGAAIRSHRLRLGMSQETLAERAELHRTYVTDVERGVRNLSLESISKLARALDLSISSLFSPPEINLAGSKTDRGSVEILLVEHDAKELERTLEAFKRAKLSNRIPIFRDDAAALGKSSRLSTKSPPCDWDSFALVRFESCFLPRQFSARRGNDIRTGSPIRL